MLINQDPIFTPVLIEFQTRAEADAFFALLTLQPGERHDAAERLKAKLSDWFSNNYRLILSKSRTQERNPLKKIIQNLLALIFLPVMVLGLVWALTREAWEMGADCYGILPNWFNSK